MTKICRNCNRVYADRYVYCALCGDKLSMHDGKWKDCSAITHNDLKYELQKFALNIELRSHVTTFIAILAISITLIGIAPSLAFIDTDAANKVSDAATILLVFSAVYLIFGFVLWYLGYRKMVKSRNQNS